MAKDETKRLTTAVMKNDETAFNALEKINGYVPSNPAYTIDALRRGFDEMNAARAAEDQIAAALATANDKAISAEWKFHNLMLIAKDHVISIFGKDSLELQEIGLKKISDYKRPSRKAKPNAGAKSAA